MAIRIVVVVLLAALLSRAPIAATSKHGEAGTLEIPGGKIVLRWYSFDTGGEYAALGLFRYDKAEDEQAVIFLNRAQWGEFCDAFKRASSRIGYATDVQECVGTASGFNGNDDETISVYLGKKGAGAVVEIRIQAKEREVSADLSYQKCPPVIRLIDLLNAHFHW